MKQLILLIFGLLLLSACSGETPQIKTVDVKADPLVDTSTSADPAPTTCGEAEYNQLDFWLGDWDLTWDNGDGTQGRGRNLITKTPFNNCVVTENFDGTPAIPLKGLSVSTYSKPHKKWRQTWVDNNGSYFSLHGGPDADGVFSLDMERLDDKGPYSRMIWKDVTGNSLTWHWQGKKLETDDWADQWVIYYTRKDKG